MFYARDPDIIKQITIRDFDHFTDLGFFDESLSNIHRNDLGLLTRTGEDWRTLKSLVMPAFSLKNMKSVTPTVNNICQTFVQSVKSRSEEFEKGANVEELIGGYAMEIITQVGFGISADSIKNPDNEFTKAANNIFQTWTFALAMFAPWFLKLFSIPLVEPKSYDFLINTSLDIIKARDGKNINREDVLGRMIKIRNNEIQDNDSAESLGEVKKTFTLTNDLISKTMVQFFSDGFDSVTTLLSFSLYLLALNPKAQEQAHHEVEEISAKFGDDLTGEAVNELKYLDQVLSEAARISAQPMTGRRCTKDWTIPGTNVTLPKGIRVTLPIQGLHTDPDLFPDPEEFRPERFSPENKSQIKSGSYLPFGMGPRMCIGMKILRLEGKAFLYHVLKNFRIEPCEKTTVPLAWRKDHFNRLEGGTWIQLLPRSQRWCVN